MKTRFLALVVLTAILLGDCHPASPRDTTSAALPPTRLADTSTPPVALPAVRGTPLQTPTEPTGPVATRASFGWPDNAEGLVAHLNQWDRETFEYLEEQQGFVSGETSAWIGGHVAALAKLGVQITWNPEVDRYEICATAGSLPPAAPGKPLVQLHILDQQGNAAASECNVSSQGSAHVVRCHLREHWWAALPETALLCRTWALAPSDIAEYDWAQQTITLTAQASTRLLAAYEHGLVAAWTGKAFVVALSGIPLYGGFFSVVPVATLTGVTVIHLAVQGERIVFRVQTIRPAIPVSRNRLDGPMESP